MFPALFGWLYAVEIERFAEGVVEPMPIEPAGEIKRLEVAVSAVPFAL